ncbi:MAG: macro domain-containing protein [Thermodesulfobacteriota bacterium]
MISFVEGNLFESPAQVLVNTVNTVGAMGKGIAKEFRRIYPEMFKKYQDLCESGKLGIGDLFLHKTENKWIVNFPTKEHWKNPSKIEYLQIGLEKFSREYSRMGIHSIAFPPLGAGNGELDFESIVRPVMLRYLSDLPIQIFIYPNRTDPYAPEHLTPKEIKSWLRSEPKSLSFIEVWEDVKRIVASRSTFKTLSRGARFQALIEPESKKLVIITSSKRMAVEYDYLLKFWQQIRNNGFSIHKFAPREIYESIWYLIPIFSELDYVKLARYKEIVQDSEQAIFSTGLQYWPVGIKESNQQSLFPV